MIFFLLFMLIWLVVTVTVIAVHFWFLSVPVLCVGGTLAVRRHQHRRELARRRPGPRDPWLNEVVVAVADLGLDEWERNLADAHFNVPVDAYVELRRDRLTVNVVLFANQSLARNAEIAMRAQPTIRGEIDREMTALHNGGRVLIVARTKLGAVDDYDFGEIVRRVGEIPLPPPLPARHPVISRSASGLPVASPRAASAMLAPGHLPREQDAIDQLDRLGRLRASGVLTDEEFQAKKAELLQRI